jgi:hypothetical protein
MSQGFSMEHDASSQNTKSQNHGFTNQRFDRKQCPDSPKSEVPKTFGDRAPGHGPRSYRKAGPQRRVSTCLSAGDWGFWDAIVVVGCIADPTVNLREAISRVRASDIGNQVE